MRSHVTIGKFCSSARKVSNHGQHGPHLLGRGVPGAPTSRDIGAVDAAHSLFQLQAIPFENKFVDRVSTFFDSGSNVNLVTESFARRARLKGQPVHQSLSTTGGKVSEWTTKAYFVPLIDRWGKIQEVLAYSIGIIMSPTEDADL